MRPRLPPLEALRRQILCRYRDTSRKRCIPFSLDPEEFYALIYKPCHYCGAAPANEKRRSNYEVILLYSGLDRMDNTKGYHRDNVVPCCHRCNFVKGTLLTHGEMRVVGKVLRALDLGLVQLPQELFQLLAARGQLARILTILQKKKAGRPES